MEIAMKQDGTPTVFALEGRLDTNTSPQLEEYAGGLYGKGVSYDPLAKPDAVAPPSPHRGRLKY